MVFQKRNDNFLLFTKMKYRDFCVSVLDNTLINTAALGCAAVVELEIKIIISVRDNANSFPSGRATLRDIILSHDRVKQLSEDVIKSIRKTCKGSTFLQGYDTRE